MCSNKIVKAYVREIKRKFIWKMYRMLGSDIAPFFFFLIV